MPSTEWHFSAKNFLLFTIFTFNSSYVVHNINSLLTDNKLRSQRIWKMIKTSMTKFDFITGTDTGASSSTIRRWQIGGNGKGFVLVVRNAISAVRHHYVPRYLQGLLVIRYDYTYFHLALFSELFLMLVLWFHTGNTLILGVNCDGLMLIKPEDKFVMYEFRYTDVESIFLDPSDCFLTINLMRHQNDSASAHKCFVFETQQKSEIGSLIVSYCPGLAGWIIENEAPVRIE